MTYGIISSIYHLFFLQCVMYFFYHQGVATFGYSNTFKLDLSINLLDCYFIDI